MLVFLYICIFLGLFTYSSKDKFSMHIIFAFVFGFLCSIYATWWIHPSFQDFFYYESNFLDYCQTLTTYNQPLEEAGSPKRSRLAGIFPYILTKYVGSIDAIAISSVIWTGICFSCLYLWAFFLTDSKNAGLFAVFCALTLAPLYTMGRQINFYPAIIATLVMGGMTFTFWAKKKNTFRTFTLGVVIGVLLLIDLRGILWALTYWGGALVLICISLPYRKWLFRCFILHIPIVISWYIAQWAYPPNTMPLEYQTNIENFLSAQQYVKTEYQDGYIWGRRSLLSIFDLLIYLKEQAFVEITFEDYLKLRLNFIEKKQYDSNMNSLLFYSILPCLFLLRKPKIFCILLIGILPFMASWKGVFDFVEFHLRLYAQATPMLALCFGISMSTIISLIPCKRISIHSILYTILVCIFGYAMIWGHIDNSFTPKAPWQPKWYPKADELNKINEMLLDGALENTQDVRIQDCYTLIHEENQPWVRTYNVVYEKIQFLQPPNITR